MIGAFFDTFPSFSFEGCADSLKDDIITIEDITNLEEGSATGWQLLKQG